MIWVVPLFESSLERTFRPGVNVMITIFCDFRQYLAEKIGVFLKNQSCNPNFAKTSSI
jgi:hypothetical protein